MSGTHSAKILIADDETLIALLLGDVLEDCAYVVEMVADGQEAIRAAASDPPDLVIADVWMPRASGIDVVLSLRRSEATRDTPVILMSAGAMPYLADIEGVRFVPKPFDLAALIELVADILRRGERDVGAIGA